jgi:hypothetical protein
VLSLSSGSKYFGWCVAVYTWHCVLKKNGEGGVGIGASSSPVGTTVWENYAHGPSQVIRAVRYML